MGVNRTVDYTFSLSGEWRGWLGLVPAVRRSRSFPRDCAAYKTASSCVTRSLPLGRPALCLHPISGFWSRLCLSARCTLGLGRKQLGSALRFESAFSPRTRDGYKPTLVALWGLLLTSVLPEPSPAGAEATCALETSTYLFALDVILDFVCF